MEELTLDQLKGLGQARQNPSISLFMPTHRAGPQTQQDPIRFKNLLREAEQRLSENGKGGREASEFLQPARDLLEDAPFWQHQDGGLAVFIAQDDFRTYRLPFPIDELLIISNAYYVKPILPLFTNNGFYYILAISQNEVRLFEATRHSIHQIDMPADTPESLDEALPFDQLGKQLQFHTGTSQGGIRSAVFHGHGGGEEEQKERVERYLNLVDQGLQEIFRGKNAPLVLAGVDYLLPMYHKVSGYANILEEGITGSPEQLRPEELQERAWPLVEPYFRQELEAVIAQYHELAGTGIATDHIEEVVAAAFYGRVDKLVLATDSQLWGVFDPDTGKVVHYHAEPSHEDDIALIDFAATQTLQNGGAVYALTQEEMPTDASVLAVFRY